MAKWYEIIRVLREKYSDEEIVNMIERLSDFSDNLKFFGGEGNLTDDECMVLLAMNDGQP